jgi:hypothetical protein
MPWLESKQVAASTIELHQSALTRRDFHFSFFFYVHFSPRRWILPASTSFESILRQKQNLHKSCNGKCIVMNLVLTLAKEYLLFHLKGFLLAGLLIIPDYNEFILGELFSLLHASKHGRNSSEIIKHSEEVGQQSTSRKSWKSGSGKQSNLLKHTYTVPLALVEMRKVYPSISRINKICNEN